MSVLVAVSAGFLAGAGAAIVAGFRWVEPRPARPVTLADITGDAPARPERFIWDGHRKWVDPRHVFEDTFR